MTPDPTSDSSTIPPKADVAMMAFRCVLAAGNTIIASLWFSLGVVLVYLRTTPPDGTFLLFQPKFIEYGLLPTAWRIALPLSILMVRFLLRDFSDHPQLKRQTKRQLFNLLIFAIILGAANSHY